MESEDAIATPSDGSISGSQKPRPIHGRTSGPTRRSTKGQWTAEEDEVLRKAVERFKGKSWKKIAECFKDRTDVQCLHRWQKVLNPELVKGPWSKEEDGIIIELVNKYGPKKWSTIAQHLPGRIGKQCRERWHNHLNPAINKEAWTQEEELVLIRAHQRHGNRWAKLTEFLPGRTDNAIKNHWNSSVKKKIDSYIASGLLSQFPVLKSPAGYQSQLAGSSSMMQSSGDDTVMKGGVEAEEISECSQGSPVICSQTAPDMVLHGKKDLRFLDDSALENELNSSPVSSSGRYYLMEYTTLNIPDRHPEAAQYSDQQVEFSQGNETATAKNYINADNMPDISLLELEQEPSGFPYDIVAGGSHHSDYVPYQPSVDPMITSSLGALAIDPDQLHHILTSDEECCRILFSEAVDDGLSSNLKVSDSSHFYRYPDSLSNQSSNIQISGNCGSLTQQYEDSKLDHIGALDGQSSMPTAPLSYDAQKMIFNRKQNQLPEVPPTAPEDFVNTHDGFIYINDSANSPQGRETELETTEMSDLPKDQVKLISVDTFGSPSDATEIFLKEEMNVKVEKPEPRSLYYEPPRFPSLDIPFFSCDLVQSSNDMQMDYSPLGIRQLMMSSMNCISPLRLWDSPTHDSSPDAMLKNAAKTFTNTPSILRKRHRDLLSPLSEKRIDKKQGTDITSNLSREFSRLDVVFDEKEIGRASPQSPLSKQEMKSKFPNIDNAENLSNSSGAIVNKDDNTATLPEKIQQKGNEGSGSEDNMEHVAGVTNSVVKHGSQAGVSLNPIQLPGILSEHDLNDMLLYSPDQTSQRTDNKLSGTITRTPRKPCSGIVATCSGHMYSSGNSCPPITSSPVSRTCGSSQKLASASKMCLHTSAPLDTVVNTASHESMGLFSGTPFRRSIESPSAWKSPWFLHSFLPGPRIDTEITIEDIGYIMSPGDGSYDALGLMKQVSEQSASVYANAEEVLGNDTPNEKNIITGNLERRNKRPDQPAGTTSGFVSNLSIERRTLDFSECGTPGKSKEKGKSSTTMTSPSPSSYLLKACR
ncbi:hypothetical protein SAY86_002968 [Trapa natans]|uniref:Uncharacterized protein n=1 Tax=Trapa natans TaxID=22666 RepID=A0AAN7LK30_TRANT|nr:hypothetical protein SAY86_002968 [Trapa natans]